MLDCDHDGPAFGVPVCLHLRTSDERSIKYFKWYTGTSMDYQLHCDSCATQAESGSLPKVLRVCEPCYQRVAEDCGEQQGVRGAPGIRERLEPLDATLRKSILPAAVVDLAPIREGSRSLWLLLTEKRALLRFDADSGESTQVGVVAAQAEPERQPWCGRVARNHLHASRRGDFAAVVSDYGRTGQVIDLNRGKVTLTLDGGDYHPETVPFSFAFVESDGRTIAVHRSAWNRLDLSDPADGRLLSAREASREHHLDYFHGALYVSPDDRRILDDGWVWHPVGIPRTWELEPWLMDNPWESEDGPSARNLCDRAYYWDSGMAWLDDRRVAIEGFGDDDIDMLPGARIFDVTSRGGPDSRWATELFPFPGPSGSFFGDRGRLYSVDGTGLSIWNPDSGELTGRIPGFQPTHQHRGTQELACVVDGALVRWRNHSNPGVAAGL